MADITRDYMVVRNLGLALAVLAFVLAVARLTSSDFPHERARAQGLLLKAAIAFLFLAGDRLIAQGVVGWFGFSQDLLPVFWQ